MLSLFLRLQMKLVLQLSLLQPWLGPDIGLVLLLLAMHDTGRSDITPLLRDLPTSVRSSSYPVPHFRQRCCAA